MRYLAPFLIALCALVVVAHAQNPTAGDAELQRCRDRIATVQREILNRYEASLQELQQGFQKVADLEGALAVRNERQRAAKEGVLSEKQLVAEPRALRALQNQTLGKMQELIGQVVHESLPRLIESKRTLTMAGKLDEAVALRDALERLQSEHLPLSMPDPALPVQVDTLLLAYSADRGKADKVYRSQKFTVRGVLAGYRSDPADAKQFHLYLGGSSNGWVQCAFSASDFTFREEKQLTGSFLAVIPKAGEAGVLRLQKGQNLEIRGVCDGYDEYVRFTRCDLVK